MLDQKIAVVGLGYVGLPLAVAFGKTEYAPIIGFDIQEKRITELQGGKDASGEIQEKDLLATKIHYTTDPKLLRDANFIIVAVPTPISKANVPDLGPVIAASKTIGANLSPGSIVVYESTVYPGVTEEICIPLIEKMSGLQCGKDWKIGYSPERINPGDHEHTIDKVIKVVSGMDEESLDIIAKTYGRVCQAGVHRAPTIKTAEAAKVIENVQRDLNIALMNELSLIFERLGIQTRDVLEAAGTKWNFHPYRPGLVGGHCIGVDPYYLTYRAQEMGYHPQVILSGRYINDSMGFHVGELMIKGLIEAGHVVQNATVLVLGLTFKENVADARNSKVEDIIQKLQEYHIRVLAYDPFFIGNKKTMFGAELIDHLVNLPSPIHGIVLAVAHEAFQKLDVKDYKKMMLAPGVLIDVKNVINPQSLKDHDEVIYKGL